MTTEQRRSPSPASSPTKLPPSGPLQPIQKAPSRRRPGSQPRPFPATGPPGRSRAPRGPPAEPRREERRLTRSVHGAHAARRGNGSFGVLTPALRRLGGRTCPSHPERRKAESGSVAEEGERNGVRGGTKLPPRVAESAPSGLAPPRGGQSGRAADALRPAGAPTRAWCPRGSGPRGPLGLRFPNPGRPPGIRSAPRRKP